MVALKFIYTLNKYNPLPELNIFERERYYKEVKQYKKHKATCIKNRKKRKSKRK